jgi:hypothetical protein
MTSTRTKAGGWRPPSPSDLGQLWEQGQGGERVIRRPVTAHPNTPLALESPT